MASQDFVTYDPIFGKHCATAFAGRGATYTEYEPADRYGYKLGTNEHYRVGTGSPSKLTPVVIGNYTTPAAGSASKTPSTMAGTKSARGPRGEQKRAGEGDRSPWRRPP